MEQTQISSWLSDFETKLSYAANDSEHNTAYADAIPIGADLASCMADYYIRSYQARRNIKEAQMRKSSDFTDTESEALDEFFAEMSVVKERSDAD